MLNKYDKQQLIGCGTFGNVYLIKDKDNDQLYVLKEVKLRSMSAAEKDQSLTEVAVLARCRHRNIIRYKEAMIDKNSGYLGIVMEFAEHGDMYAAIQKQNGVHFPEDDVLSWFIQINLALQYIHNHNILHRDLKTQNIFLAGNKMIKVGDFGIARMLKDDDELATTAIGTPYYLSPEIYKKQPYNYKSDMWALGCILFEMTALVHPFRAQNLHELINSIMSLQFKEFPSHCSPLIRDLVKLLLCGDPEKRPSTDEILSIPNLQPHLYKHFETFSTSEALRAMDVMSVAAIKKDSYRRRFSSDDVLEVAKKTVGVKRTASTSAELKSSQKIRRQSIYPNKIPAKPTNSTSIVLNARKKLLPKLPVKSPKIEQVFKIKKALVNDKTEASSSQKSSNVLSRKSSSTLSQKSTNIPPTQKSTNTPPQKSTNIPPQKSTNIPPQKSTNIPPTQKSNSAPTRSKNEPSCKSSNAPSQKNGEPSCKSKNTPPQKSNSVKMNKTYSLLRKALGKTEKGLGLLSPKIPKEDLPKVTFGSESDIGYQSGETSKEKTTDLLTEKKDSQKHWSLPPLDPYYYEVCDVSEEVSRISVADDSVFEVRSKSQSDLMSCPHMTECQYCIFGTLWKNRIKSAGNVDDIEKIRLRHVLQKVLGKSQFESIYDILSREWNDQSHNQDSSLQIIVQKLNYEQRQYVPLLVQLLQLDLVKNLPL